MYKFPLSFLHFFLKVIHISPPPSHTHTQFFEFFSAIFQSYAVLSVSLFCPYTLLYSTHTALSGSGCINVPTNLPMPAHPPTHLAWPQPILPVTPPAALLPCPPSSGYPLIQPKLPCLTMYYQSSCPHFGASCIRPN